MDTERRPRVEAMASGIVDPGRLACAGIERDSSCERCREKQRVPDHQGRRFEHRPGMGPATHADVVVNRRPSPRDLEPLHVAAIDLIDRRVFRARVVVAVDGPLGGGWPC